MRRSLGCLGVAIVVLVLCGALALAQGWIVDRETPLADLRQEAVATAVLPAEEPLEEGDVVVAPPAEEPVEEPAEEEVVDTLEECLEAEAAGFGPLDCEVFVEEPAEEVVVEEEVDQDLTLLVRSLERRFGRIEAQIEEVNVPDLSDEFESLRARLDTVLDQEDLQAIERRLEVLEEEIVALQEEPDVETEAVGGGVQLFAGPPPVADDDILTPRLFDADTQPSGDGEGFFDIGVKETQIGLVFGWHVAWPQGNLDAGGEGCDLVVLSPGWYENLYLVDARYEIYDVPSLDREGWVEVLTQQRAEEQAADYRCPALTVDEVPVWTSEIESPPPGVEGIEPQVSEPETPDGGGAVEPGANRRDMTQAQNGQLSFRAGERVVGYEIHLSDGTVYNSCVLDRAPMDGYVIDGVVDPWEDEFRSASACQ